MKNLVCLILGLVLVLPGCGSSAVLGLSEPIPVQAASPPGFTSTSVVRGLSNRVWQIDVEAVIPETTSPVTYRLPFLLPVLGTVNNFAALEGTTVLRSSCQKAWYVAKVAVDDDRGYAFGGGVGSFFVSYRTFVRYTQGQGEVRVTALVNCSGPTTWEFHGLLLAEQR